MMCNGKKYIYWKPLKHKVALHTITKLPACVKGLEWMHRHVLNLILFAFVSAIFNLSSVLCSELMKHAGFIMKTTELVDEKYDC